MTLTDFARLNAMQNQMEEARQHYEEALQIQRQVAQQNPAVYLPQVAMTLDNLGAVDRLQNRIEESRVHQTEALTIHRTLAGGDPARYTANVARVQSSLQQLEENTHSR